MFAFLLLHAHLAHLERPFPYLVGVGLVLRLHSVRSRATSWVTPTAVMSSFSCWGHVFLGHPRRLVPGMARFITLRVTLSASRLWTCPNQQRRPQRITSSIGEMCRMRRMSSFRMWSRFDTPRIPRSILISVVAIFLLLVTFIAQHSLPYVRAGLIMASYTFALSLRGIFRSYNTPYCFKDSGFRHKLVGLIKFDWSLLLVRMHFIVMFWCWRCYKMITAKLLQLHKLCHLVDMISLFWAIYNRYINRLRGTAHHWGSPMHKTSMWSSLRLTWKACVKVIR